MMTADMPKTALSVRQPWAWLIVNGFKDIENRDWRTHQRGRVLIHASKGMTRGEYEDAHLMATIINKGIAVPAMTDLHRGGLVGSVEITDCVSASKSKWFFGKYGFVLRNAKTMPFEPYRGQLGFFPVEFLNG